MSYSGASRALGGVAVKDINSATGPTGLSPSCIEQTTRAVKSFVSLTDRFLFYNCMFSGGLELMGYIVLFLFAYKKKKTASSGSVSGLIR